MRFSGIRGNQNESLEASLFRASVAPLVLTFFFAKWTAYSKPKRDFVISRKSQNLKGTSGNSHIWDSQDPKVLGSWLSQM